MTRPASNLAIVTGANGNLGRAVVARLEAAGQRVARIEHTNIMLDGATIGEVDLSDAANVRAAFNDLAQRGGGVAAVVHTVGIFRFGPAFTAVPDQDFVELFEVNVLTGIHVQQAALALMLPARAGRIAIVCSLDAVQGGAQKAAYAASKAAQLRAMESAAAEIRGSGVTLNAVLPGTMDTPQNRAAMPDADPNTWVKLDEVASVLAFLVSDAASGIHGQALRVER